MARLIEVRPIEKKKWHDKKGIESFTRPQKIQVLVDTETMRYATGLTEEDLKHLKKLGVTYDLSDTFNTEEAHPFWDNPMGAFKLENNTMFFDADKPLEYIKIKNMKASKYVANTLKEYDEGYYPEATHYIHDEVEQNEILATEVERKNKAIIEASKMSVDRKLEIILAISGKNLKGQSNAFIEVELDKILNVKKTQDKVSGAEEFLRYTSMNKSDLSVYALVLEALQKNVLRKDGHKILFMDSVIGTDETDVAKYLNIDENQDLKISIMAKIN